MDDESLRALRPRLPVARVAFSVLAAFGASGLAVAVYVAALLLGALPSRPFSVIFFTVAVGAAWVGTPIVLVRARVEDDPALFWAGVGLGLASVALTLQLISFPTVAAGGGLFRTDGDSSALLYLTFHVALFGGAAAGALGLRLGAAQWVASAGVLVCLLEAANLVPAPVLLTPNQTFTRAELTLQWVVCLLGLVAVAVWVRSGGLKPAPLPGWVGLALLLLTYEIALNALAGKRYEAMWWASLSLRAAAFTALALGALGYVLRQGRRLEVYTRDALQHREQELTSRVSIIDQLLTSAADLATSLTPEQVGDVLCTTARRMTGAPTAVVSHLDLDTGMLTRLAAAGPVDEGPGPLVVPPGLPAPSTPAYAAGADELAVPRRDSEPGAPGAIAVLPLRVPDLVVGVLEVRREAGAAWTQAEQELLQGLADQGGPALSRSRLAQRERQVAETLQRSLLPAQLPSLPRLQLAATYRAATLGHLVGGDWYDAWTLADGGLVLVIGDVVGKGLTAAAATGRLRASIRTLAATDPGPSAVLTGLDAIEADGGPVMVATVAYALLDPGLRRLRLSRAGHLPPLLAVPGRRPVLLDQDGGPPIGVAARPYPEEVVDLPEEFLLMLYTDGLVEHRRVALDDRLQLLVDTVHTHAGPDPLTDALMGALEPHGDDVAVLTASTRPG
jgi:serine phosphatase RsbU (regulator of sigma subunit)